MNDPQGCSSANRRHNTHLKLSKADLVFYMCYFLLPTEMPCGTKRKFFSHLRAGILEAVNFLQQICSLSD